MPSVHLMKAKGEAMEANTMQRDDGGFFGRILCGLGFHDFEVVEYLSKGEARQAFSSGRVPRYNHGDTFGAGKSRVCLRCGKVVDEIPEFQERIRAEVSHEQYRRRLARKMLGNSREAAE